MMMVGNNQNTSNARHWLMGNKTPIESKIQIEITDTPPLCLGCYCPVENSLCSRCGWPICGTECEASPNHAGECAVFAAAKVRFQPVNDWTTSAPQLDCITPLR